jgi:ADP-heptose:LPS heptosyltransferase
MQWVFNPSPNTFVSVREKTIPPMGFGNMTPEEMDHPGMLVHLRTGALRVSDDTEATAGSAEMIMKHLLPYDDLVLERTYALGDVFLTTGVVDAINSALPGVKVHFYTSDGARPLLMHHPGMVLIKNVQDLYNNIQRHGNYIKLDNVPELYEEHHLPDVRYSRIEIMCNHLGIEPVSLCPSYYLTDAETDLGRNVVSRYPAPYLGIAPVSRRIEKMWDVTEWTILTRLWKQRTKGTVFCFHSQEIPEISKAGVVRLDWFDLRSAAAVAFHMDVFVTLDSLWTHLVAALGCPQVLLTSCTDGELLARDYPKTIVLHSSDDCYPCWYQFPHEKCSLSNPPQCLLAVSAGRVADAVEKLTGD